MLDDLAQFIDKTKMPGPDNEIVLELKGDVADSLDVIVKDAAESLAAMHDDRPRLVHLPNGDILGLRPGTTILVLVEVRIALPNNGGFMVRHDNRQYDTDEY